VFYAYTSVVGGNFVEPFRTKDYLLLLLGQKNALTINGYYWQLLTSMFIHINIIHLFGNMLFLLIFGFRAEELFTPEEFFFIYFLSGLSGNLLTLLMSPETVSAGASGAIFGTFGACVIYPRKTFGQSIMGALIYSFFLLMITAGINVNILAHFGGLVAGLMIGYALAKSRKIVF
jgi:rhomboid protease GluP